MAIYTDANATVVAALDPVTLIDLIGNPALAPIAAEASDRITGRKLHLRGMTRWAARTADDHTSGTPMSAQA